MSSDCCESTIFWFSVTIQWVSILSSLCFFQKISWERFCAVVIFYAWWVWIDASTGTIHHLGFDSAEQKWIIYWVWKFFILKPSQKVEMWQATLLPLNCVHVALNVSKNIFLGDDCEDSVLRPGMKRVSRRGFTKMQFYWRTTRQRSWCWQLNQQWRAPKTTLSFTFKNSPLYTIYL